MNIDEIRFENLVSQVHMDTVTFEGMPRMIFEDEHRNQKINWIKLVNNMISFNQQKTENMTKRNTIRLEKEAQSPLIKSKHLNKNKMLNL